ncbi:MAG: hypothetical protein FWF96_01695 [Kiritimatiellaeota bacterium]|nr:hypothetical protein [Kiritimatiellota bacterium]
MSKIKKHIAALEAAFTGIPTKWDGKSAIIEMKDAGFRHWRQMEWIGFYFQFLCEQKLKDLFEMQQPKYGHAAFDGLFHIPFDFKAHATNTSTHTIICNDREAVESALRDYGAVGLLIAVGDVTYNDENRSFQKWHDEAKGKTSAYVQRNRERGAWSRLRKQEMDLRQITMVELTRAALVKCGSFQTHFRNSDGSPRREKISIDLEKLGPEIVHCINFNP